MTVNRKDIFYFHRRASISLNFVKRSIFVEIEKRGFYFNISVPSFLPKNIQIKP